MVWTGRSSILVRSLGRQFAPSSHYKAAVCGSQVLSSCHNVGQVRHKSGLSFPVITEYVNNPPVVSGTIFSDWTPVVLMQDCLYQLHDLAGIGWVPTIALSTIGLQLLVGLPVRVMQQQTTARLQNLVPELKKLKQEIALEVAIAKKTYNWSEKKCNKVFRDADKKHFRELVKEHNCHPMRAAALGLVQVTPWLSLSMAIRNIVFMLPDSVPEIASDQQYRYMQLAVENLPWLDSLVAPDPFILPGIFVLASLINIQLALPQKVDVPQKTARNILPWIFRGVVVGVGVMGTFLPSAVTLYWAVSSSSAVALNVLLKVPYVRSVFRIPKTVSVNPQPQMQSLKPKKKWLKFPFSFKPKRPAV